MRLIIAATDKNIIHNNLVSIRIMTKSGEVQIKPGHAEYFAEVVSGEVIFITKAGDILTGAVNGGVCYVSKDEVSIIC